MSQEQLAVAAQVSRPTVRDIERETGDPRRSSMLAVESYLRSRGIRFVDDLGIVGAPPT
jgi:predicted transcriptional regulator